MTRTSRQGGADQHFVKFALRITSSAFSAAPPQVVVAAPCSDFTCIQAILELAALRQLLELIFHAPSARRAELHPGRLARVSPISSVSPQSSRSTSDSSFRRLILNSSKLVFAVRFLLALLAPRMPFCPPAAHTWDTLSNHSCRTRGLASHATPSSIQDVRVHSKVSSRSVAVVFHEVLEAIGHRVAAHWSPSTVRPTLLRWWRLARLPSAGAQPGIGSTCSTGRQRRPSTAQSALRRSAPLHAALVFSRASPFSTSSSGGLVLHSSGLTLTPR